MRSESAQDSPSPINKSETFVILSTGIDEGDHYCLSRNLN